MIYVIDEIDFGELVNQTVIEGPDMKRREFSDLYKKYRNKICLGCWSTEEFDTYKEYEKDRLAKIKKIWENEEFIGDKYFKCEYDKWDEDISTLKGKYALNMLIKYHNFNKIEWKSI